MIVVGELQCVGASHEKVNSGFLTLLRAAYPAEPIRVYADRSHQRALEAILEHDGVEVANVEFRDVPFREAYGVIGALTVYRRIERMLRETLRAGGTRVLFLSLSPLLLHFVKRLQRDPAIARLQIASVLHADFEDIANETYRDVETTVVETPSLRERLRSVSIAELPAKARALVAREVSRRARLAWQRRFRERDELLRPDSHAITFIALAPHIVTNAARHIDVEALDLVTVEMPYNFAPLASPPQNEHPKFATFGYGDPASLRKIVEELDRLSLVRPYEIRIIGMDNRGLENHPRVFCPSPGKPMARADMERHAADVDAFIIPYTRSRYQLSCSGAIFEALSYVKPVLHIGNPSIAQFDPVEAPIGFGAPDLETLARTMGSIIDDYPGHRAALDERRRNLEALRRRLSTESLVPKLRAAFGDMR